MSQNDSIDIGLEEVELRKDEEIHLLQQLIRIPNSVVSGVLS